MRIICLSDTHLTVPENDSRSLFPRQISALGNKGPEFYEAMRREISLAYKTSVAWIDSHKPWDCLIHFGDVTGGYAERGVSHPSAKSLAQETVRELRQLAPNVRFCLGNHDTGYSHPGSLPGSGITMESLSACKQIFGDLCWSFEDDGILWLGVCSPIAEYAGRQEEILALQKQQKTFLKDVLGSWTGKWVLCAHNPFVVKSLTQELKPHTKRLLRMVAGDYHNPSQWNLVKKIITAPRRFLPDDSAGRTALECLSKCTACPSTAPLWWHGYGLLLIYSGRNKFYTEVVQIEKLEESKSLPVSSLMRCAWWMIRPQGQ